MHNSCCATEDTDCSNNIFYLFQQHILSVPTTYPISSNDMTYLFQQQEEGESLTYDTPSFEYIVSQTLFLVSFLVRTLVKNANSWAFILFFRRIYIILHHSIIM